MLTREIVARVEKVHLSTPYAKYVSPLQAGYDVLVVTVDSPVFGSREADWENDFSGLPPVRVRGPRMYSVVLHNIQGDCIQGLALSNYPTTRSWDDRTEKAWDQNTERLFDTSVTWNDIVEVTDRMHICSNPYTRNAHVY
jgi:isopentenyl diphosphate isomerase/L-lactate dehydrogenase-like FMN-dependent dehydrogenase